MAEFKMPIGHNGEWLMSLEQKRELMKFRPDLFPKDDAKFVMGIDYGGYDGNTYAACIAKKQDGVVDIVEYLNTRNKVNFDEEVKRFAEYYNIPDENILKEVNTK